MFWIFLLTLFLLVSLLSDRLVKFCIHVAHRAKILDVANERSLHSGAKPRTGGLAFLVLVTLAGLGWALVDPASNGVPLYPLILASLLVGMISFYDDIKGLSTVVRFAVHFIAAASVLYFYNLHYPFVLPGGVQIYHPWVVQVGLILWMVGLTNAYNFMDGCDGIAGLQALMAGLGWVFLGIGTDGVDEMAVFYGVVIAGTALGFLKYNWSPSKLFLGDVGSAFLGFTFASLPLLAAGNSHSLGRTLGAGALVVWPFVVDAFFTFIRRLFRGENVLKAHRSHLYQRLVLAGWKHHQVALLYGLLALSGWPLAWLWLTGSGWVLGLSPFLVVGFFALLWFLVSHVEKKSVILARVTQS